MTDKKPVEEVLHIAMPQTVELTIGYVAERIVEYWERTGHKPDRITMRPKAFIKYLLLLNPDSYTTGAKILDIPLDCKVK
jgi:hypothetical protein